jgi:hypothetical protein
VVADLDDKQLILDPGIDRHARIPIGRVGVADGVRACLRDRERDIVGIRGVTACGLECGDHRMTQGRYRLRRRLGSSGEDDVHSHSPARRCSIGKPPDGATPHACPRQQATVPLGLAFLTLAAGAILLVAGELWTGATRRAPRNLVLSGISIGFILGFVTDLVLVYAGA